MIGNYLDDNTTKKIVALLWEYANLFSCNFIEMSSMDSLEHIMLHAPICKNNLIIFEEHCVKFYAKL